MNERLELFARVCVALQHAHRKGIIHRDVKPSNVLVTMRDGVPAPKVIDFGIAKATQGRLTDATLVTGLDQFIGTPAYMSPEQAERRDLDIDTRSDVYSLGVLLYELLTGRPPYDPKSLQQAGLNEIRRIIREVDPPRPSTAVSTLTDADRTTVARLRRAVPTQLTSVLRGDLDWIVMRCLEKERGRRYESAHALADDVRRHLRSEPVEARPAERLYRLRKFVARNRVVCGSAAAVVLALVIGTVVSVRQAVRATRAGHAETIARSDAQRRQEQAEDLLTFMLGDFRTELEEIGRLALLDNVGDRAMTYFAELDARDLTDTALARQAKALTQIGATRIEQGRYDEAAVATQTAYDRAAALVARHPADGDMLFERAQAEYWIGYVARRRGAFAAERAWLTRYRDSAIRLAAVEGRTTRAMQERIYGDHALAVLDLEAGDLMTARVGFERGRDLAMALLETDPDNPEFRDSLADLSSWLGTVATQDGRLADGLASYQDMERRNLGLIALEPTVPRWHFRTAEARIFVGNLHALLGDRAAAAQAYAEAREGMDALVKRDGANRSWEIGALTVRLQQAVLLLAVDDTAATAPMLTETRERLEALVAAEPTALGFQRYLMTAWRLEARLRLALGRADAAAAIGRALELGEKRLADRAADERLVCEFAQVNLLAGRVAAAANDEGAALAYWQRVEALLAPDLDSTRDWRRLEPGAQARVLRGAVAEARPLIQRLDTSGYRPIDPLAVATFDAARLPEGKIPNL